MIYYVGFVDFIEKFRIMRTLTGARSRKIQNCKSHMTKKSRKNNTLVKVLQIYLYMYIIYFDAYSDKI